MRPKPPAEVLNEHVFWARVSRGNNSAKGGTRMTWAEKLHDAIERHDVTALRRMADETQKEDTRIFLNLLAGIIQQQTKEATQLKRTA